MSSAFLAFEERAAIFGGNVQGDWGASPTSDFRLCIYKDTARTVTRIAVIADSGFYPTVC